MRIQGQASSRYHSLDHWRGLACLMVLVYHCSGRGWDANSDSQGMLDEIARWVLKVSEFGWIGVPIFFVISGYCIAASADSARRNGLSSSQYFWRRFRRIFPPYWIFLAGAVAVMCLTYGTRFAIDGRNDNPPQSLNIMEWLANATLTWTWAPSGTGEQCRQLQSHTWTLCYEEQFYAVMGGMLFFARRYLWSASIVITYSSIVGFVALSRFGFNLDGTFMDGSWIAFAAGVWVYYLRTCTDNRCAFIATFVSLPAIAWVCRHPSQLLDCGHVHSQEAFLAVSVVTAIALIALSRYDAAISQAATLGPVAFCGRMCYSLYLVHLPITAMVVNGLQRSGFDSQRDRLLYAIPIGVIASLFVAWPFHVFVERRFMNKN